MNCPRCGKETSHKWNFCSKCGLQLKEKIVVVQYNRPDGTDTENRLAKLFKERHPEAKRAGVIDHDEVAKMLEILCARSNVRFNSATSEEEELDALLENFVLNEAIFCVKARYELCQPEN